MRLLSLLRRMWRVGRVGGRGWRRWRGRIWELGVGYCHAHPGHGVRHVVPHNTAKGLQWSSRLIYPSVTQRKRCPGYQG